MNDKIIINIFTDGSCNTEFKIGGWAAIIFFQDQKIILKGREFNTTHNRMELLGAIKALEYIENKSIYFDLVKINSDSQYLIKLIERKERFKKFNFLNKKGTPVQNIDLVSKIIDFIDNINIEFIKVIAHQKKNNEQNFNREVDMLSRNIVRQSVSEYFHK